MRSYIKFLEELPLDDNIDDNIQYSIYVALDEAIGNSIKHPLNARLPYRPLVASYRHGNLVWTEIEEQNPRFDPRVIEWRMTPDSKGASSPCASSSRAGMASCS